MEAVEFEVKELLVAIAIGGAGHGTDLVIDAFEFAAGDRVLEVVEDAGGVGAQGLGQAFHLADAAAQGAGDPAFQEAVHGVAGAPGPEQAQFLLEIVGAGERLVEAQGLGKFFALVLGEVLVAGEQQVAVAFEGRLAEHLGCALKGAPQVVDLFMGQFDDVKVVEDDGRPGQVFEDGTPVSGAHVAGHRLHARPGQPPPELAPRILAAPLGHPENATGVQIDDQRDNA